MTDEVNCSIYGTYRFSAHGPCVAVCHRMRDLRTNWPEDRLNGWDRERSASTCAAVRKRYDSRDESHAIVEAGGEPPTYEVENVKRRKGTRSKDDLVISSFDKERLTRLLQAPETSSEDRAELEDLTREIERGAEVRPEEMPPDVVTRNSTVRLTDLESGSSHVYTIVFPGDADYDTGKISILASLGTALLGYRVGDIVTWRLPGGNRRLKINEILYQPEAAGDFHL